ncbi:substrate-binding domain-containing protein [Bacillus spongiae]|uniref:Substrate-binding domain-containing protein n=1 Tax=Bacillus spongiae TaxID=2683610 RepID=A0ABU8HHD5_9BACI
MQKFIVFLLSFVCCVLLYFTIISVGTVFRTDWQLPQSKSNEESEYHLVLITQELDTPFWSQVGVGAKTQAEKEDASLEVWGSYGKNQEDFLKKMEIAIYSQIDGIIVQGLDTEEFTDLIREKASSYGIPVITVANDIPKDASLRRTYVGSNQYLAGQMVAQQLVSDMGESGEVVLMYNSEKEYYQEQRLNGMKEVLKDYPTIQTIEVGTVDKREGIISTTRALLNEKPNLDAFIAVDANITGDMIQELESRSQIEPYYLYSFDDNPESLSLLKQGKLDGILEQSPSEMGKVSVTLMMSWLRNETVPLDWEGYLTDIRMVKVTDMK